MHGVGTLALTTMSLQHFFYFDSHRSTTCPMKSLMRFILQLDFPFIYKIHIYTYYNICMHTYMVYMYTYMYKYTEKTFVLNQDSMKLHDENVRFCGHHLFRSRKDNHQSCAVLEVVAFCDEPGLMTWLFSMENPKILMKCVFFLDRWFLVS